MNGVNLRKLIGVLACLFIFLLTIQCNQAPDIGGIKWVKVDGGVFKMGSDEGWSEEKPIHDVRLDTYYISKYEVTVGQYMAFVEETQSHHPEWQKIGSKFHLQGGASDYYRKLGESLTESDSPIVGVSWNDAVSFCEWLSKKTGQNIHLPSEAQWEFAARGGNSSRNYEYSGGVYPKDVAWYKENSIETIHSVGKKAPNELGIYDMSGNVSEWCHDWFYRSYYREGTGAEPVYNPQGPIKGSNRVIRGGNWNYPAHDCRVAFRRSKHPGVRDNYLGFRLCLSPGGEFKKEISRNEKD